MSLCAILRQRGFQTIRVTRPRTFYSYIVYCIYELVKVPFATLWRVAASGDWDCAIASPQPSLSVPSATGLPVPAPVTDTVAPVVSITNPLASARDSGNISVQAKGTDNIAVTNLKLYIDGQLKSTVSGSSLMYKWNTKQASWGAHTLKVEARDAAGNLATHEIQVLK